MNPAMWQHPLTTRNVERLKQIGYKFLEPESGMVLCGEEGEGRLMSVATLVEQFLGSQSVLQGKTILITAGPTREPIDPVRYVTNRSSGKMGYALAKSASALGAKVILISGPTALKRPSTLHFIEVGTAAEMLSATLAHLPGCDLLIASAAVADYSPIEVATQKIKKKADHFSIDLKRTEDILLKISTMPHRPLLVGFAAETSELETHALNKLKEKRLDAIIANDVSQNDIGFERDDNACTIYFKDGKPHIFSKTSKVQLAERILQTLGEKFYAKGST